jgi:hypothetical protein
MRAVLHLILAFVVALSSVTMVQARHQARAHGDMVICTGIGMITVAVDAQGQPVGPMLPCPDCTPALAALDAGPAPVPGPALRLLALAHPLRATPAPVVGAPVFHHARAPPAAV